MRSRSGSLALTETSATELPTFLIGEVMGRRAAATRGLRDDLRGELHERRDRDPALLDRRCGRVRRGADRDAERIGIGGRVGGAGRSERDPRLTLLVREEPQRRRIDRCPWRGRPDDLDVELVDDRAAVPHPHDERGLRAGVNLEIRGLDSREDAHGRESTPGFPPTYTAPVGASTWDKRGPHERDQVRRLRIGERGCGPVLRHVRQSPQPCRGQGDRRRGDEDHRSPRRRGLTSPSSRARAARAATSGSAAGQRRHPIARPKTSADTEVVADLETTLRRPDDHLRRVRHDQRRDPHLLPQVRERAQAGGRAATTAATVADASTNLAACPRPRSGRGRRGHRADRRARARRQARGNARAERPGVDGADRRASSPPRRPTILPTATARRSPRARCPGKIAFARCPAGGGDCSIFIRPADARRRRPRSSARPTPRRSIRRSRATGRRSCTWCSPALRVVTISSRQGRPALDRVRRHQSGLGAG